MTEDRRLERIAAKREQHLDELERKSKTMQPHEIATKVQAIGEKVILLAHCMLRSNQTEDEIQILIQDLDNEADKLNEIIFALSE